MVKKRLVAVVLSLAMISVGNFHMLTQEGIIHQGSS